MNEGQSAHLARRLETIREQLMGQLRWFDGGLGQSLQDSVQELSSYDNHPADLGSEVFERSKDFALRENVRRRLEAVNEALARLRTGSYGYCERCGEPIEKERLEALPETSLCVKCRRVTEGGSGHRRRPVEEEVIRPPFGGLYGQGNEVVEFDGEDAWQDVARYGTSESISDVPGSRRYPEVYVDREEDRGAVEDVDTLPYSYDAENGMFYESHTGVDDERPPRETTI